MNALHLAAFGGHLELAKYLMPKFGDNRFELNQAAQSCLHYAVWNGHPKVVQYLIEEGGFDPSLRDKVSRYYVCVVTSMISYAFICRMTWTASFWPAIMAS